VAVQHLSPEMDLISAIRIDKELPVPLHVQIRQNLQELVNRKGLKVGQRVATEMGICNHLKVSITPVRQAVDGLVRDGLVERRRAKGIFVVNRSKKQTRTKTLAFLVLAVSHNFFGDMVHGAELAARTSGYQLVISNTDYKTQEEFTNLKKLGESELSALLIYPSALTSTEHRLLEYRYKGIPVVLVDRTFSNDDYDSVCNNNLAIGHDATEYLIGLGHKQITYVTHGASNLDPGIHRQLGFEQVMATHGLEPQVEFVSCSRADDNLTDLEGFKAHVERFVNNSGPLPTAMFAVNDTIAIELCRVLGVLGIRVPEDVSVLGVADLDIGQYLYRPLTTIAQHTFDMGREAVRLAIDRIEGRIKYNERRRIIIPHELVVRETCAPPRDVKPG